MPRSLKRSDSAAADRISPIFRDRDELPSTASLSDAVNDALGESEWLIVICSPDAAASRWVNEEIRTFRRLGRSNRILCFVVGGEPGSGTESECLPAALTEPDAPGRPRAEPVAADARAEGDGKTNALLKIVAGMLGTGFDALKQREQTRRFRRLAAASTVLLFVSIVTVALAITATVARDEANARRAQAEDLINFMLGDLQDQLRGIGRLDLYEGIGNEARRYFAALADRGLSYEARSQRATNLRQLGEVYGEQGNLDDALPLFEESLAVMQTLVEDEPANADYQLGLAHSHFYIGFVHWQRGNLAEARREFELVVPIVDALSERDPENTTWLAERGYAYTNLARVRELEGSLDDALDAYRNVLVIDQRLVDLEPEVTDWILEVGFAHNNIGKLVISLGRLDEAEQSYRTDLRLKKQVSDADPQHNTNRSWLAVSQYFLGQLLNSRGKFDEAATYLYAALANFEELVRNDPQQIDWQRRLANTQREIGRLLVNSRSDEDGRPFISDSVALLGALAESNPDDAPSRRDLVRSVLMLARLDAESGDAGLADRSLASARTQIELLIGLEPTSRETRYLAANADVVAAEIAARRRDGNSEDLFLRALEAIDGRFADSEDPYVLDLRAIALSGLGRVGEARRIAARLENEGFLVSAL